MKEVVKPARKPVIKPKPGKAQTRAQAKGKAGPKPEPKAKPEPVKAEKPAKPVEKPVKSDKAAKADAEHSRALEDKRMRSTDGPGQRKRASVPPDPGGTRARCRRQSQCRAQQGHRAYVEKIRAKVKGNIVLPLASAVIPSRCSTWINCLTAR